MHLPRPPNRPAAEQELLASRLLAELAVEDDFDRAIAASTDKLAELALEAIAEYCAGLTEELDPDQLWVAHDATVPRAVVSPAGPRQAPTLGRHIGYSNKTRPIRVFTSSRSTATRPSFQRGSVSAIGPSA